MIKTIVTGSTGFIGNHLIKRLPDAESVKHDDIVLSDFSRFDRIFFLSTYGNMSHHDKYKQIVLANVTQMLSALIRFKGWVCYMSSSSVMLPVQTPYSRTKRAAEEILQALPELKSCIVRPFSITGVNEQKEHLIPTLIRSCMEGTPMDFDASPVHDFVDVSDVVDGLIALADAKATGIHEFGRGMPISNHDIREMVEQICDKKANIQSHIMMRPYDNTEWYCKNPSQFFTHTKPIYQSITEMVEAYKREHGI
jgi:nucleoside-diphosphate-sugar epimerase